MRLLACAVLFGCVGPGGNKPATVAAGPLAELFAGRTVLVGELAPAQPLPELAPGATVVVLSAQPRSSGSWLDEAQRTALAGFVAAGGRLCLFGHAASLATELGIESEWPERSSFRWGFDRRTAIGRARLGVQVVSGRVPEWFDGLGASAQDEHTFHLVARQPCDVPICTWSQGAPQRGEVLAVLAVELDGRAVASQAPAVVRWSHGRGAVVAVGLGPDLGSADATIAANAAQFVRNVVARAGEPGQPPLVMLGVPLTRVAAAAPVAMDLGAREVPAAPQLAHWGWQAALAPADDDTQARPYAELIDDVLLPSWQAGADLLEVGLGQRDRGAPLAWREGDRLKPPSSWRGGAFWPQWTTRTLGDLAAEAHARGVLLQAAVDPLPVGDRVEERLVALRYFARELADLRRLGARALDGLGVRDWWPDTSGLGVAMVQDFQPGAYLYSAGELTPTFAGALRALDADDGAPAGLPFAGISARWRDGFPAAEFPLGVLDARASRPAALVPYDVPAGGSAPDWLVAQINHFVRSRRDQGAALWWRAHDPATLGPQTAAYVQGLSMEPLRAAVAMPLAATGAGGLRAAAAELLDEVQSGFGAELPAPAAVHVLQNNWLRLVGSGGGLLFDPSGMARFQPGEPAVLSAGLLRTRLFGGRPNGDALRTTTQDFLAAGTRGAGGYGSTSGIGGARAEDRRLPAVLAFGAAPQWPQRVAIECELDTGYHELELVLRGVQGRGLCAVRLDDVLLRCVPFRTGERLAIVTVPVHVARPGLRQLSLTVLEGGSVGIDRMQLVRRGDVGAEAEVVVPAGSVASLAERSASSYHAERLEFTMLADMPGLLMRVHCDRAVRSLQVERTLSLPGYTRLLRSSAGERADALRGPFVLRAADLALPDLVVAPLLLARYDRFRFGAEGLQMLSAPEPGAEARVGFLLVGRDDSERVLGQARRLFAALDQPLALDLGATGEASLSPELPFAWTQLLRLEAGVRTPFAVRENGWWTWRGAQPADDGGVWLRVVHVPGDTVQVVGGPTLLARTRPGPGSRAVLALRDVSSSAAVVRVLQPSRLVPPSVVFAADFDEVYVDGAPWAHFDGNTVFLPDVPGIYAVKTRQHGGGVGVHVRRTAAPLRRCAFDPRSRQLLLSTALDPARPPELPYTAVLTGPRPTRVDNGEVLDDAELRHADAETRAQALAGGVVIRFRSGITKVHYGE
ncbi:MAG: hypothetical protein H6835_20020 [Planctomycetes bacterium]|nr:hypothetical protein [Planctomycetota bacterium]